MSCSYKVLYGFDDDVIDGFLSLPGKLYSKSEITQDYDTENKLLHKTHVLSDDFEILPIIVKDNVDTVARCMLTYYPDDDNAYFGFYECINDKTVSGLLFDEVFSKIRKDKKICLVGPLDASFWIKYRLKINSFDKPYYIGEPYNKDYYKDLISSYGFEVIKHYTSNLYSVVDKNYINKKFKDSYSKAINNGYNFVTVKKDTYDKNIIEIYHLLTALYSDFPMYKDISLDKFKMLFNNYKIIADYKMIKLAYYKDELAGFLIGLPDYGNIPYRYKSTILKLLKIIKYKKKPKQYVLLYLGVANEHRGLGKALSNAVLIDLQEKGVSSIGALAMDGKVTQTYADDVVDNIFEYALFEKKVEDMYE